MSARNTHSSYGCISRWLHGLLFLTTSVMLIVGSLMGEIADKGLRGQVVGIHKITGLVVLGIGILFVVWSLINPKPRYPDTMPCWEKLVAKIVRFGLYFLVLALPLSGWIFTTAGGHAPEWFGTALAMPGIELSKAVKDFWAEAHEIMAWTLFGFIILHITGALKHHFIDKNDLLVRMFCSKCSR